MRVLTICGVLSASLACLAPVHAEPNPADRVVGSIYGKNITAANVKLTTPIDPAVKFDARDKDLWDLMGRISAKFGKPISDRFVKDQKIVATADEIAAFKKNARESNERQLRENIDQLEAVHVMLGSPDLSEEKRAELIKKRDMLDRFVSSYRTSLAHETPDEMARHFIVTWKTERELHRKYGGRIIFQQFGPEALDARRMLYEEAEKTGDLKFTDPGVRHLFFYYYSNMRHATIDDDTLFERASFWGDPAMAKPK